MALIFLLCVLFIAHNHATILRPTISSNTTLTLVNSPYYLNADVVIESGVTLIIENGARIYLNDSHLIKCNGHIISGCNEFVASSSSIPARGIDETQFVYFYGGEGIMMQGSGFGHFCNTQFDAMKSALIDDSDNTATFVDHCWFRQTNKALQLKSTGTHGTHYIRHSVFDEIYDSVITGTDVVIDNCRFDTFYKLFANTPSNIMFRNSELVNCQSVCFEVYASQNSEFHNNLVMSAEQGLVIKTDETSMFKVSSNTFMNCRDFAVESYHRLTVFENNVFDGNMHALFADENKFTLINNTFINNRGLAAEIQLDADVDALIEGNLFANNGGDACTSNLVDISGGGRWLQMQGNIFRNNSCQNAIVAVKDNQFTRVRDNTFIDCTSTGNLIEIVMLPTATPTTSTTISLVGNVSIDHNQFILTSNVDRDISSMVYISAYHGVQATYNIFHARNPITNYILLNDAKTNALRVSHNTFYALHNVQRVLALQNTPYHVNASYNRYGTDDNETTIQVREIAEKMYDACEDSTLGQILFCPWIVANTTASDCECDRVDLCTALDCVLDVPSTTGITGSDPSQLLTPTPLTTGTLRPSLSALLPSLSPSSDPSTTAFVGVVIEIKFVTTTLQNSTDKTRMAQDLKSIILSVINGTIPSNCVVQLQINDAYASTSNNRSNVSYVTVFDVRLSVCDAQAEQDLLLLFDTGGGIDELEREIVSRNQDVELPEISVNVHEAEVDTPSSTLNNEAEEESEGGGGGGVERLIRQHFMYLVAISGVLLITLVVGVIQYCRYERDQLIKNHHALVNGGDNARHKSTGGTVVDSQTSVPSAQSNESVPCVQAQPGSIFQVPNESVSIQFAPRSIPPYPGGYAAVYDPQLEMYRFSPSQVYGQAVAMDMMLHHSAGAGGSVAGGGEANSNAGSSYQSHPRSRHMIQQQHHDMNHIFSMDDAELQGLRAFVEDDDEDNEEDEMMYDHHVTANDNDAEPNTTTKGPNEPEMEPCKSHHTVEPSHDGNSPVIEGDERLITNNVNLARPLTLK